MIFYNKILKSLIILYLTSLYATANDQHLLELQAKTQKLTGKFLLSPQIKEIVFKNTIPHDRKFLTSDEVFTILQQSGLMNSIPLDTPGYQPEFGSSITETPFGSITQFGGGFYSDQVYKISLEPTWAMQADQKDFIIKIIQWGGGNTPDRIKSSAQPAPIKEVQDMERVKQVLVPIITEVQKTDPLFPIIATHESAFYYFDDQFNKHYLTILPIVPGQSANQIITTQAGSAIAVNKTMEQIGRALGEFHYQLASEEEKQKLFSTDFSEFKTIVHGDFHLGNIFIAPTNQVSFIDNASMAESLVTSQSPFIDIFRLYSMTLHVYNLNSMFSISYKNLKQSFMSFIKGYVLAFPEETRDKIEASILKALMLADKIVAKNMEYLSKGETNQLEKTNDLYGKSGLNQLLTISINSFMRYLKNSSSPQTLINKLSIDLSNPDLEEPSRPIPPPLHKSLDGYYTSDQSPTNERKVHSPESDGYYSPAAPFAQKLNSVDVY